MGMEQLERLHDLEVAESKIPQVVQMLQSGCKWDNTEVKEMIHHALAHYQESGLAPGLIKLAKSDRAQINKTKKAFNDRKIEIKKEYMKGYTEFETKVKELFTEFDEAIEYLDGYIVKETEKEKSEKLEEIRKLFNTKQFPLETTLEEIMKDDWLNKTKDMKDIEQSMDFVKEKQRNDLKVLENVNNSEMAIELYKKYKNLDEVLTRLNEYQETAKKVEAPKEEPVKEEPKFETPKEQSQYYDEVPPEKQEEYEQTFEVTLKIKGTKTQLKAMKEYIKNLGMEFTQL